MSALLVDTCDRRADRDPISAVKADLGRWLRERPASERASSARLLQERISASMADLASDCPARQRQARDCLFRAGLSAAAAPIIQSWLQTVIDTGEVPAA